MSACVLACVISLCGRLCCHCTSYNQAFGVLCVCYMSCLDFLLCILNILALYLDITYCILYIVLIYLLCTSFNVKICIHVFECQNEYPCI